MVMDTKLKLAMCSFLVMSLYGCASVPLNPGAENVVFTTAIVPPSCQFLRQVWSYDTNGYTTAYTSHVNLQAMEINTLKNKAYKLGANVVVLTSHLTTYAHQRSSQESYPLVYSQSLVGGAYLCPSNVLSTLPNVDAAAILDEKQ